MEARVRTLFHNVVVRYLFAIALVAGTFALRVWLSPWTGTDAPFMLFFAAVLMASLFAGVGPGIVAVLLSMILGAYTFVTGAGYSIGQASFQSLLFAADGIVVVYLTFLTSKAARSLQHANRQLGESGEKYHTLFASIDEGFCVIDVLFDAADHAVDYRFLEVNPAFQKQAGISDVVGRRIREIVPALEEHWFRTFGHIALTGEARRFENQARALGRFYDVYAFRLGSPEQRRVAVLFHDITTRKRIEDELKAANAFLDAIVEHIPLMLFIKDGQSLRFIRVNRTSEDVLGWPKQTLIGKTDYDLWPKEQAEFFIEKDRETLRSGSVVDIPEEAIQTRHQGARILHTKKVPVATAGKPDFLLGISEDITERKRIEREQQFLAEVSVALSASLDYEQTLATLARLVVRDVADWCVIDVMDEHGRLTRLKVACADPAKESLCRVLEQMPPDRNLPHLMRSVSESRRPVVVEQVTSQYLESIAQGPDSLQALVATGVTSFVAVPLLLRGQSLGALLIGSSTLARVCGQANLRLAEALAERAAMAIENARLYRAAVQATDLRDQVLGIVAHDLRNPLSVILTQAWMLRPHGPKPERRSRKPAEVIERAATRMNRLIQDLLDVAVMESGQLAITPARLSARELIVRSADMQKPLVSSSSLELRVAVDDDVPDVWGDRERLFQVLENLIGNAIKFTKAGGCITIGAAARDHEVIFRVADTGTGIAPENLPRLFDRFWQATRDDSRGAGLGLPIVKGIVEAHGGRIWVESTPNRGTTFLFAIPQATPEQGHPSGPSGSSLLEGSRAA